MRGEGLGNWQIVLKENNQKILTGSGSTVLIALYRFVGLLYLKGLFCENDFHKIGFRAASKLLKNKTRR